MSLHPQLVAVVDAIDPATPRDIVLASVLLVCAQTGLGLGESLSQARAAVARHTLNKAARREARPAYRPQVINVAGEAVIREGKRSDT